LILALGCLSAQPTAHAQERASITLGEAGSILVERSRDLAISELSIEQARLLRDQARSVLLPNLNLGFQYTFRDTEVEFDLPNFYAPLLPYLEPVYTAANLEQFFEDNPDVPDARLLARAEAEPSIIQFQHDYRFDATLYQTIFDWRALSLLDQAATTLAQAENGREQLLYQLQGGLEALYFDAVSLRRLVELGEGNVELTEIDFQRATGAYEEEVGNRFEMTRAEVAVQTARRQLETTRLSYELLLEALRVYLDLEELVDVVPPADLEPLEGLDQAREIALRNRPELRGLALETQLHEEQLAEIRAGWFPTVRAQAQATTVRESAFAGDAFSWSIGLILSWDIWDGGLRIAQRRVAQLGLEADTLRTERQMGIIDSEIRSAFMRLESQHRVMPSIRSEAELAERNDWVTREAFALGAATALDVDVAQQQLYLARVALARAEVELQALIYDLHRVSGAATLAE